MKLLLVFIALLKSETTKHKSKMVATKLLQIATWYDVSLQCFWIVSKVTQTSLPLIHTYCIGKQHICAQRLYVSINIHTSNAHILKP